MKRIILLLIIVVSMSSCLWTPMKMSKHKRRLFIHQNYPREYYYRTHPTQQDKVKSGKRYKPYFRNGRW